MSDDRRIAIIGMSGRFPGAPDLDAYWRLCAEGRDALTRFEDDEPGARSPGPGDAYVRARGLLDGIEDFDAAFFDFGPEEAARVDPQHRLWLEVAYEALEASGHAHGRHGQVVSVHAGSFPSTYLLHNLLPDRDAVEEYVRMRRAQSFALLVQNDPAFLPTRTAYKLDLRGPAVNVQTACSTSLVAISMAAQALLSGESDVALAGGVCIAVPQRTGYFYQEGAIHARDGVCRPYDARACGTVFGNGAGAVVLKRLADARRDGDPVLAVLLGAAVNNDGRGKVSYHAPSVQGQAEVIATAQALAGVEPGSIGYVEGHGTATPLGDPIEVEALRLAFAADRRRGACALGSAKGNVGHLDAAAGVAGLIRAVLALRHRELPATAHFERPNPELRLEDSPFFVTGRTLPWPEGPTPRRAGVSAFGIGGTNAHVILEEATDAPRRPRVARGTPGRATLLLSARAPAALDAATARLAGWMERSAADGTAPVPVAEVAAALDGRRERHALRRAVQVESWDDAVAALRDPSRFTSGEALEGQPRVVFAFPGQGSLRPGALARPLEEEPALAAAFEPLARSASDLCGFDLLRWARDPGADARPLREDNATAQLALFSVSLGLARWLEGQGVRAEGVVGHSLGEWAGAALSGVLPTADALRLVHRRGQLMQATGPGAALVVHLSEAAVAPFLGEGVTLACVNGPALCLLSGRPGDVARCAERLRAAGVEHRAPPVDVAVHSPIMAPVVEGLAAALAGVRLSPPGRRILSSVTGRWLGDAEAADPGYWAAQAGRPVRFDRAAEALLAEPGTVAIEVGLGETLTTLLRAQVREPKRQRALPLLGRGAGDRHALARALDALWAAGVDVPRTAPPPPGAEAPTLPTYPFQRRRCWKDPPGVAAAPASPASRAGLRPAPAAAPGEEQATAAREAVPAALAELTGRPAAALDLSVPLGALGLDSIQLVQLAEALSGRLGTPVSFAEVVRARTAAGLVEALDARAAARLPVPVLAPTAGAAFSGLFTIREGGRGVPLLFIHPDLASDYLPLHLPPGQPIYGYLHQGSEGERIERASVEALAERCLEEWTAAHGDGPCILAGHSFGGLVALEVAHRMRRAGRRVELLALVDVIHPRCFQNPFRPPGARWARRAVRLGLRTAAYQRDVLLGRAALGLRGRVPLALRTKYVIGTYELAARRYGAPAVDVDTLLFLADGTYLNAPLQGWDPAQFRSLETFHVGGNHLTVLRDPALFASVARELAPRVAARLAG